MGAFFNSLCFKHLSGIAHPYSFTQRPLHFDLLIMELKCFSVGREEKEQPASLGTNSGLFNMCCQRKGMSDQRDIQQFTNCCSCADHPCLLGKFFGTQAVGQVLFTA